MENRIYSDLSGKDGFPLIDPVLLHRNDQTGIQEQISNKMNNPKTNLGISEMLNPDPENRRYGAVHTSHRKPISLLTTETSNPHKSPEYKHFNTCEPAPRPTEMNIRDILEEGEEQEGRVHPRKRISIGDLMEESSNIDGSFATTIPNTYHSSWRPFESFHLFSRLPRELRQEIWKFSLPGPRVIRPSTENEQHAKDPAMLYVNNEAREVTLKYYTRKEAVDVFYNFHHDLERLSVNIAKSELATKSPAYINFNTDIVCIEPDQLCHLTRGELAKIKHAQTWVAEHSVRSCVENIIDFIPNVKSIKLKVWFSWGTYLGPSMAQDAMQHIQQLNVKRGIQRKVPQIEVMEADKQDRKMGLQHVSY